MQELRNKLARFIGSLEGKEKPLESIPWLAVAKECVRVQKEIVDTEMRIEKANFRLKGMVNAKDHHVSVENVLLETMNNLSTNGKMVEVDKKDLADLITPGYVPQVEDAAWAAMAKECIRTQRELKYCEEEIAEVSCELKELLEVKMRFVSIESLLLDTLELLVPMEGWNQNG